MQEHDDHLYLGTWDMSRTIAFLSREADEVARRFRRLLAVLSPRAHGWDSPVGDVLYRTPDGIDWEPIFLDGLSSPDNHSIRILEATPMGLFVRTENPFSRLEIWLLPDQ
jgi:hypothetical protein